MTVIEFFCYHLLKSMGLWQKTWELLKTGKYVCLHFFCLFSAMILCSYEFLKESLTSALSQSDIVVTSGGVSMGEKVPQICC